MIGFRISYPKIWHLKTPSAEGVWENGRSRKDTLTSQPLSLENRRQISLWKKKKETFLSLEIENLGPRSLYKQTLLLLHHLLPITQIPLSCQCFTNLSFSTKYNSFLLWSLLWVAILLWGLLCTCNNSIKFMCFSPVTMPYISLILRPSQSPQDGRRGFPSLHKVTPNLQGSGWLTSF